MIAVKKDVAEEFSKTFNKNVFSRGDFDEFKISDEELKEYEKEIEEEPENVEKSYTKREFVSGKGKRKDYWRVRTYDGIEGKKQNKGKLDNPTLVTKDVKKLKEYILKYKEKQTSHEKKVIQDIIKQGNWKKVKTTKGNKVNVDVQKFSDMEKEAIEWEIKNATVLADRGFSVYLPKEIHNIQNFKNIDAIVDGLKIEFRYINTNNPKTLQGKYREKLEQSPHVSINFNKKADKNSKLYINRLNGTQSDNPKGILICYFEKSDEFRVFDYNLEIKKAALSATLDRPEISPPTLESSHENRSLSSKINKSNEYSVKRIKEEFQKDFTVKISDVTENNKVKKIEQLEKALNCVYDGTPFKISHIPTDSSKNYGDVTLRIKDFDKSKIEKAVRNLSFSLDVPLKAANGEVFYYKAQEELTNIIVNDLTRTSRALYDFVISYFGLPERTIMSKAYLKYKGKILYSPETGEPINKRDWKKFVKALELFLNRNHRGFGKKIVLTSRKLGKLLEKMAMYQTADKIRVLPLSEIKEPGKKSGFNWNENDPEKIEKIFSEKAEKWESARVEIAEMSAAQKITKIDDVLKNDIQQILIDGIKNKKSKGQVSQDLFDRCASLNRDIQRIADTEIQNNVNNAFIAETVRENEESGKKTYFIRREVIDGNTCEKCKKLNGKIAVWSNSPLENEKVKDPYAEYAIWEGKDDWNFVAPNGVKHPYCRGVWDSWDPEFDELPEDKGVKKSLTWSGYKLQGRKKFAGFNISIENKKGSYREGIDPNGHKWKVKMYHDYGYIRGSVGTDGDHVDCYLGPNENAKKVYIVHQQDPDTKKYDEDKCMIGFNSQAEARAAYLKQYDRPGFLQSITAMDLEEFRQKVLNPENKGKMIKSLNAEMQKSITQTIEEIFNR